MKCVVNCISQITCPKKILKNNHINHEISPKKKRGRPKKIISNTTSDVKIDDNPIKNTDNTSISDIEILDNNITPTTVITNGMGDLSEYFIDNFYETTKTYYPSPNSMNVYNCL